MPSELETPPQMNGDQPSTESGNGFGVSDFLKDAAAAPKAEANYEDNTSPDGSGSRAAQDNSAEGADNQPQPPETPAAPRRSIQEIQAHRHQQAKARVFDGLGEEEIPLFKQMSQQAYDYLYPKYLASREQEARIKELEEKANAADSRRWYEEPDAYTLHPEYRELQDHSNNLGIEERFWTEQLANIEENKPFYTLERERGPDGKYVYKYGSEQQPSATAKATIISNLAALTQHKISASGKLKSLQADFAGKHKSFNDSLGKINKTVFGGVDFNGDNPIAKSYNAYLNQFPAEFRSQLPYQLIAQSGAVIEALVERIRSSEATKTAKAGVAKVVKVAGPGSGVATSSGAPDEAERLNRGFSAMTRRPL